MASGKVHNRVNIIVIIALGSLVSIAIIAGIIPINAGLAWFVLGVSFGYLFDPDTDQIGVTYAEKKLTDTTMLPFFFLNKRTERYKKIYHMILLCWKVFLYPYAVVFKHRSIWSHLPGLSDIIRVLYVLFMAYLVWNVLFVSFLGLKFGIGMAVNFQSALTWMFTQNMNLFYYIFSLQDILYKVVFIVGSSLMTLSHLAMDKFKLRT